MSHPLFEIVTTTAGAISIRNKLVNEIMHNPVGPWLESNTLYIQQSKLAERLLQDPTSELVVFDVGLGAAANALATLHCHKKTAGARPLKIISFERDLELLKFALENAKQFDHFRGFEPALAQILEQGSWSAPGVTWELRHGDFVELIRTEPEHPHVVFFDPYSPQVNIDMWTVANFRQLRAKCREAMNGGTVLYTYSRATPIRAALLSAGFFVGAGIKIGMKAETTQASTVLQELAAPFQERWLVRWKKSHAAFPLGLSEDQQGEIAELILNHPQFQFTSSGGSGTSGL